jgi:hypothetical protein
LQISWIKSRVQHKKFLICSATVFKKLYSRGEIGGKILPQNAMWRCMIFRSELNIKFFFSSLALFHLAPANL